MSNAGYGTPTTATQRAACSLGDQHLSCPSSHPPERLSCPLFKSSSLSRPCSCQCTFSSSSSLLPSTHPPCCAPPYHSPCRPHPPPPPSLSLGPRVEVQILILLLLLLLVLLLLLHVFRCSQPPQCSSSSSLACAWQCLTCSAPDLSSAVTAMCLSSWTYPKHDSVKWQKYLPEGAHRAMVFWHVVEEGVLCREVQPRLAIFPNAFVAAEQFADTIFPNF